MTEQEIRALHARAQALRAELARRDPDSFMSYVLRDEETGERFEQAPYHSAWQKLLTDHRRLILWSHVESGKTQQLSIGRVLWEVGRNPALRAVVVSNTGLQARKLVRSIGQYITDSDECKAVFPELKPAGQWTADTLVVQRPQVAKDATVQATGMHGNILGARIDLLIMDDVIDYENSRTEYQRQEALNWIESTLFGRLTRNARVVIIGNAWHREDLMHVLAKRPLWEARKFPAVTLDGVPQWTARWDTERLEHKRLELGPLEFARQMQCEARADGASRFRQKDVDACIERGIGRAFISRASEGTFPGSTQLFTGVDLAISTKKTADMTVFFTMALHANGDREVICIESGRWTAQEIMQRLHDHYERYRDIGDGRYKIIVENNQGQDFLVQLAQGAWLPVYRHTTHRGNKAHPTWGVESLSAEIARAQWIIPSGDGRRLHPEVVQWTDEMLYYDPAGHTGDRLMACWIAREAARRAEGRCHRFSGSDMGTVSNEPKLLVSKDIRRLEDHNARAKRQGAEAMWTDLKNIIG